MNEGPEMASASNPSGEENRSGLAKALSLYSAYGWRGRIGLVAPSTNTTLEPEFNRMAPDGVAVHVSRVFQSGRQGDVSSYRRMADGIATAAKLLTTAEIDVMAFGCTSCTYYVPPDEIRATMRENSGVPAILTADAVVTALRALGVKRISVIGPRTDLVTQREIEFLKDENFDVIAAKCLGLGATEEERRAIGRVPQQVLYRLALTANQKDSEALFISCTQLPTLEMIEPLEKLLRKPVITSNQATFWHSLRTIGYTEAITGYGSLLSAY